MAKRRRGARSAPSRHRPHQPFEALVAVALDAIPEPFAAALDEIAIVITDEPSPEQRAENQIEVDETLYAVKDVGIPVLWFWPNVDAGSDGTSKGIRVFREKEEPENFHLFRNMFPEDFLRLLCGASAIVGNSSVAIRECSYLGVPAVNIGTRQMGRERGHNVIDVAHDREEIADAVATHIKRGKPKRDLLYGDGKAGARIADCLAQAALTIEKRLTY